MLHMSAAGKKHPRVNWDEVGEARARSLEGPITPLVKAPGAVQYSERSLRSPLHQAGITRPGSDVEAVAGGPIPSNSDASVAVIHTWPRPSSRANRAARRWDRDARRPRRAAGSAARPAVGDQLGMGEDEPEQQRLLLAGRGARRRHLLGAMEDREILAVRAFGGSPGRSVALRDWRGATAARSPPSQPSSAMRRARIRRRAPPPVLIERGDRRATAPRRSRHHAPPSPPRVRRATLRPSCSSASNLFRARIAAS